MKKKTMIVTGILATLTLGMAAGAYANGTLTEVKAFLDSSVQVNAGGTAISLKDEQGNEVTPLNYNNSIYLPVRGVAQGLGYEVIWDENSKTAYLSEHNEFLTFRADEELVLAKFGYTVQIPSSLGGKVRPTVWPQESLANGVASGKLSKNVKSAMDILYLPKNVKAPATVMATIEVFTQTDWAADQHDANDTVLATKGSYVYVLHNEQKNTFAATSEDYTIYQQIADQFAANQYELVLSHAINLNPTVVSQLVGKWTEKQKGTEMELTSDGVLYRAGAAVGNYLILDAGHIKFVADRAINTVSFTIDGNTLQMGGQTFTKHE